MGHIDKFLQEAFIITYTHQCMCLINLPPLNKPSRNEFQQKFLIVIRNKYYCIKPWINSCLKVICFDTFVSLCQYLNGKLNFWIASISWGPSPFTIPDALLVYTIDKAVKDWYEISFTYCGIEENCLFKSLSMELKSKTLIILD